MKIDYVSPGDPNMTPAQVAELQDALDQLLADARYRGKAVVLPPGSKVVQLDDKD